MFIKKIFEDKIDELTHKQFTRFGKGDYQKKAVYNVKIGKELVLSSTYELSNDILEFISLISNKIKSDGIILSKEKSSFFAEIGIEKEKARLFEYTVLRELSSDQIKKIANDSYFALLDCEFNGGKLKVKKKLPKPGKGPEAKVNDKFCVLNLDLKFLDKVKQEFLFDVKENFKKSRIEHTYHIKEIKIPESLKKEKNPEKIRLGALRVGEIERTVDLDGKIVKTTRKLVV